MQSSSSWPQFIRWIHKRRGWKIFSVGAFFIAVIGLADGGAENHHQHRPGVVAGMEQKCRARQIPNLAQRDERGNDAPEQDQGEPYQNGRDLMVTDSMVATAMAIAKMKLR